ncbi:MAG: Sec-independent protein translocase protein TatB [Sphingobium sp.]
MLDVGSSELLLIVVVAIVVIGPKDLPRVLYKLGQIIGKGRAMTRHFRAGIDEMIRQAEMEEMEKKWAAENARIMAQTQDAPVSGPAAESAEAPPPALPAPDEAPRPSEEAPAFRVDPAQIEPPAEPVHPAKNEGGSAA